MLAYCGQTVGWIKIKLGTDVGLGPGHIVLDGDPAPPPKKKGSQPTSQFSAYVHCGQTAGWIKMPLDMEVGLSPVDFVSDGDIATPPPSKKRGDTGPTPISGTCLLWPNGWMDQDATWCRGRPRPGPHCARWGASSRLPKRGHTCQFSAHVYCGQTAGWIRMSLGVEVGFGPCDIVLDGAQLPPKKGHAPNFGPCLLWPNGHPCQLLLSSCVIYERLRNRKLFFSL